MRLDLWFWLGGAVLVLIAGSLRAWPHADSSTRRARAWGLRAPLALVCLGLASLVAGLAWSARSTGAWPGSTPADGVAMLAGGSLVILSWMLFNDSQRPKTGDNGRRSAVVEALAMLGAGLLVLLAIGGAWRSPLPGFSAPASSWLFGLRVITASVGLGAWLPALADATWDLRTASRSPGKDGGLMPPGPRAMRTGYPWLTTAWLLGAAWNLAAAATLWRGVSPEAWLMAAWLLGGVYLIAVREPTRLPQWVLVPLTACGAAAALLQAWHAPLLLP
jgi:hypothetical protein